MPRVLCLLAVLVDAVFAEADGTAAVEPRPDVQSLAAGHDRLGWPVYTVQVPVYRVEHNPAPDYRWLVLVNDTPRQQGVYPASETSLDITPNNALNYGEGFTDYLAGAGAIAVSPFLMLGRDWDPAQRSPQHRFEMTPETRSEPLDRWFDVEPAEEGVGETPEPPDADGTP